jgi:hypothetical protein
MVSGDTLRLLGRPGITIGVGLLRGLGARRVDQGEDEAPLLRRQVVDADGGGVISPAASGAEASALSMGQRRIGRGTVQRTSLHFRAAGTVRAVREATTTRLRTLGWFREVPGRPMRRYSNCYRR